MAGGSMSGPCSLIGLSVLARSVEAEKGQSCLVALTGKRADYSKRFQRNFPILSHDMIMRLIGNESFKNYVI